MKRSVKYINTDAGKRWPAYGSAFHVTDDKHSADRLATDHKAHTTDQHTTEKKLSDAQKSATASSDKNRTTHQKQSTPTPTPR